MTTRSRGCRARLVEVVALVALVAGCTSGPGAAGIPTDTVTLAPPPLAGAPLRASVAGVPVWLFVPAGYVVPADGRDGYVEVRDAKGSVGVTVLAYDAAFRPPAVPAGAPRLPAAARVTPPPRDIVQWLRRDPALQVSPPAHAAVGRQPATVVEVTSVRAGTSVCSHEKLCTYVVGSETVDAFVNFGSTDRYAFLQPEGGPPLAVRITASRRQPEAARQVWEPLLESLVIG